MFRGTAVQPSACVPPGFELDPRHEATELEFIVTAVPPAVLASGRWNAHDPEVGARRYDVTQIESLSFRDQAARLRLSLTSEDVAWIHSQRGGTLRLIVESSGGIVTAPLVLSCK